MNNKRNNQSLEDVVLLEMNAILNEHVGEREQLLEYSCVCEVACVCGNDERVCVFLRAEREKEREHRLIAAIYCTIQKYKSSQE